MDSSLTAWTVLLFDKALGKEYMNLLRRTNLHYALGFEGTGRGSFHNVQLLVSGCLGKNKKKKKKKKSEIRVAATVANLPCAFGDSVRR